jgi:DNA polymerase-3 subunit delta
MGAVALIVGPDPLLCDREVERRLEDVRADGVPTTVLRLDASELDGLPDLRTASLLGDRTCVVIRGAEDLAGEARRDVRDALEAYAAAPDPVNALIVVASSIGRIPTLAKALAAAGEKVEVKPPADHDDRGWGRLVADEFRRLGRKADASAVAAVRAHAGTDAGVIASQVATVHHTAEPKRTVTAADVEAVLAGQGRVSAFAVADAIAARDPQAALMALRGAMGAGEAPLRIVGALTFRMRQLLLARGGADAREIGGPPGRVAHLKREAQAFHPGELAWCHDRLARLDLDLKGSDLPDDVLMDVAVMDLATSRRPGAPFDPTAPR